MLSEVKRLVIRARVEICEQCDLFRPGLRRCALPPKGCGCLIDSPLLFGKGKAHMMGQSCPHKKWQAMSKNDLITLHNTLAEGAKQ